MNSTKVFPNDISLGMTIKSICFWKAPLPAKSERKPVCLQNHTAAFHQKNPNKTRKKQTNQPTQDCCQASLRFPLIRATHTFPVVNCQTDINFKIYHVTKTTFNKMSH